MDKCSLCKEPTHNGTTLCLKHLNEGVAAWDAASASAGTSYGKDLYRRTARSMERLRDTGERHCIRCLQPERIHPTGKTCPKT